VSLPPLLEEIYATGRVEGEHGDVRVAEPTGIPRDHALWLAELVRSERLARTLETGAAYGLSTLAIAAVHAQRGSGSHIAIDPAAETVYSGIAMANVRRAGLEERVRLVVEASELALPRLVGEGVELDFALIDGSHLFDHVLVDFFYVDRMLARGGYVAFHDTWMPAIQDAVGFVLTNREYERVDHAGGGMAVLRKTGPDTRPWTHYEPFARRVREPGDPQTEARDLVGRLRDGADEAARRAGGYREHHLALAGHAVRMCFAGDALEPAMLPGFGHALRDEPSGEPSLSVVLWDSRSSGLAAPEVPWGVADVRPRGDVRGYELSDVSVFYEHVSGAVTAYDPGSDTMAFWVRDPELVPWYERGAPLRSALHHWAAAHGLHFVHAGAVGTGGRGALLVGASGSGKSTTALACLDAGMEYAGDDYVILSGGDAHRVDCLYSTAKLDARALERLPSLAGAVTAVGPRREHKAVLDVNRHGSARVVDSLVIDAVIVPTVGDGVAPEILRATAAQALRAIAPTTILQLPGSARERMTAMAALVRDVPAFGLRVGSDIAANAEAVAAICADPAKAWHSASPAG
jgi:predicted O-methyltransferase YrrM